MNVGTSKMPKQSLTLLMNPKFTLWTSMFTTVRLKFDAMPFCNVLRFATPCRVKTGYINVKGKELRLFKFFFMLYQIHTRVERFKIFRKLFNFHIAAIDRCSAQIILKKKKNSSLERNRRAPSTFLSRALFSCKGFFDDFSRVQFFIPLHRSLA